MRFKLYRTSGGYSQCPHDLAHQIGEEWFIDIISLEELLDFNKECGHDLVLTCFRDQPELEIYDTYREQEAGRRKMNAWEKTKKWVDQNRVLSGAAAGFAAGTVVPGIGNLAGAIGGAAIGFLTKKEKEVKVEEKKADDAKDS